MATFNFGLGDGSEDYRIVATDANDAADEWVLEHIPTGATFEYDGVEGAWVATAPIGSSGRPVPEVVSESTTTDGLDVPGWSVIDVSNHGFPGDMTGGDIVPFIKSNPNTVFYLPEGDYAVQSQLDLVDDTSWSQLAIIGKPHARLVIDDPSVDEFAAIGANTGTFSQLAIQNLTLVVDGVNDLDAGWGRWYVEDRVENKNLTISGRRDRWGGGDGSGNAAGGDRFSYYCNIVTEHGMGVHQNISLPDGDTAYDTQEQQGHAVGFGSEPPHVGRQFWIGCSVEEYWDNGFYVKDGTGPNILIGPYARNCGGANIRLGETDMAFGVRSFWDYDLSTNTGKEGVLLDTDDGKGTVVQGFVGRNDTSSTDCIRCRSNSQSTTYRDIYLENNTSQYSLNITGTSGTHQDGVVKVENARIIDTGDTTIRAASIKANRSNIRLEDVSIDTTGGGSSRACLHMQNGSLRLDGNSRFAAPGYAFIMGLGDGTSTVDRVLIDGIYCNGGFYIYDSTDTLDVFQLLDNDLSDVTTMYPAQPETTWNTVVSRDNIGKEV